MNKAVNGILLLFPDAKIGEQLKGDSLINSIKHLKTPISDKKLTTEEIFKKPPKKRIYPS